MIRRNRAPPVRSLAIGRSWQAALGRLACICFFAITLAACTAPAVPTEPSKMIKFLTLQRPMATDEMLQARIEVGPLAPNARIIVRLEDDSIAGTVSPFGAEARRAGGVYFIPVPAKAVKSGKVALHLELETSDTAPARAPSTDEVRSIELVVVPTTR